MRILGYATFGHCSVANSAMARLRRRAASFGFSNGGERKILSSRAQITAPSSDGERVFSMSGVSSSTSPLQPAGSVLHGITNSVAGFAPAAAATASAAFLASSSCAVFFAAAASAAAAAA